MRRHRAVGKVFGRLVAAAGRAGHEGRQVPAGHADRLLRVQVGADFDVGRVDGDAVLRADRDGLDGVDVDDVALLVERPALQEVAGRVDEAALVVFRERAGARVEQFAARIVRRLHDEEPVAEDGDIGRARAGLQHALLVDQGARAGAHAAGEVGAGAARAGDQRRELRGGPLIRDRIHVGNIVRDRAEGLRLRAQTGHAREQCTVKTHFPVSCDRRVLMG